MAPTFEKQGGRMSRSAGPVFLRGAALRSLRSAAIGTGRGLGAITLVVLLGAFGCGSPGQGGSWVMGVGGNAVGHGGAPAGAAGSAGGASGRGASGGSGAGASGAAGSSAPAMTIGAGCASDSDCNSAYCISGSSSFQGGYCSKSCTGSTVAETSCPGGSICVNVTEAAAICLESCSTQSACRTGYACVPLTSGNASVCYPACRSNADCAVGTGCNVQTGICVTALAPPSPIGGPCSQNASCANGTCYTGGAFVGGYCYGDCTQAEATTNAFCGGQLGNGICVDDGGGQYHCYGACSTGVDCRPGYACSADAGATNPQGYGVCRPRCDAPGVSCNTPYTCDGQTGNCVMPATTPATVSRVSLGSITVGSNQADWQTVQLQIPADAISFALIANPTSSPLPSVVTTTKVLAPNGTVLYDYTDPLHQDWRVAGLAGFVPFAGLFPNTPRLTLTPGAYSLTFGADVATTLQVDALIKSSSSTIASGSLALVLWFTRNQYMNATTAQTDSQLQAALARFIDVYRSIGVSITSITYNDIPDPLATQLNVPTSQDQIFQLDTVDANGSDQALNFFFCEQFNLADIPGLLGESHGAPGPPSYPGMVHSGVAVELVWLEQDPNAGAQTMAHEAGHFLGLYHTTESTGTTFDPLPDTPECPASFDTDHNGKVSPSECISRDATNLMFWAADPSVGPQATLTADQAFVVLRNPMVQ
jgi:hypothetical protein